MEQLAPQPRRRYTVDEYLHMEQDAAEKHEYRDGEIIAMAGGSANHSLIIANVCGELRNRLKGSPCRAYESNLRVRITRKTLYSYPDTTVICGPTKIDPDDSTGETVLNPKLIVEVLSPSTEGFDRGEKFGRYILLDTLEEYVLVSQDKPRVEAFYRQGDGTWLFTYFDGREAVATLRSLRVELPLTEVYAGVELPAAEAERASS
jgi:Uma2 family endonuclease